MSRVQADRDGCGGCGRILLSGELMHHLEDGRHLCQLCLASVPEAKRGDLRSTRVHVGPRGLSVVPRAA